MELYPIEYVMYGLTLLISGEQAFDCVSTNLIIKKGRGHEGNGWMASWMGIAGWWWWAAKLPFVFAIWYLVYAYGGGPLTPAIVVVLALLCAVYGLVLVNNYKIAWRKEGLF